MKNPERNGRDSLLSGSIESNVSNQRSVSYRAGKDLRFFPHHPKILTVYLPVVVLTSIFGVYVLDIPIAYYCKSLDGDTSALFSFITKFGLSTWYILGSLLLFFTFKYLYRRKIYANQALFVFLAVDILKFVFGRYRPEMLFKQNLYGFSFFSLGSSETSFPSGHATCATAVAFSLYLLYPKYKYFWAIFALPVIASRVIIGSHFLTDVVVGAYLGIGITTYLRFLFKNKGIELGDPLN
jgi:membrane-associated phospholipid phosphatase